MMQINIKKSKSMLNEFIETLKPGANIQVLITPDQLNDFAQKVATATATRIMANAIFDEKPISEKKACENLGKSRQSLAKYRKSGKLRYHTIGREIYYLQSEINEDLKNFRG